MKKQIKGISVQLGSNDVDNNIEERQRLNDQYKTIIAKFAPILQRVEVHI